ncbi:MAG: 2'-5' RNA ligase family protein [Actinobacteria bacterium]|nr:2'-5' RNA ligase family protein [Actinomycetota bacterium]
MTQIANHWWWRPGWELGTRFYTFHFTFQDQPVVQEHAAKARARLEGLPGLDLVPAQWLHLTTQGIGFADQVSEDDLAAITSAARKHLAAIAPVPVSIGPPVVAPEGIACWVGPNGALNPARNAIRAAIADVWGWDRVPEGPDWTPHVSMAYSNVSGPADIYERALDGQTNAASATLGAAQLIRLGRDRRVYEWETIATLQLGAAS